MVWFLLLFLMQDGMQREIFQKLVAKLEKHCEIIPIGSEIDYRRLISQRSIDQVTCYFALLLLLSINHYLSVVLSPDIPLKISQMHLCWAVFFILLMQFLPTSFENLFLSGKYSYTSLIRCPYHFIICIPCLIVGSITLEPICVCAYVCSGWNCICMRMQVHYFWPLDDNAVRQLEAMWCQVTNHFGGKIISSTIPVMFGR